MSNDNRPPPQREGVRFFGMLGAGLSHELSNVFNIINELSGLQHDIVTAAEQGGTGSLVRVADLAERIQTQAARGEEINRCLHHLSHSVDNDETTFDLGESMRLFGSLTARTARLAEVELTVRPPESPIAYRGDPFALLLFLHGFVMTAIKAAATERRVEVWVKEESDGIRVIVSSADPLPDLEPDTLAETPAEFGRAALTVVGFEREPGVSHRIILKLRDAASVDDEVKAED